MSYIETLIFTLPDFKTKTFPIAYTGRGKNLSPEILIENLSKDAKTIAITLEDISHPIKNFTHWIIWNIPATSKIEKAIPTDKCLSNTGITQGIAYGMHKYSGPKPPKGKTHLYRFTVYTLDCKLNISASSRKKQFLKQSEKHILQRGFVEYSFE
ncbi:MAG: YbhB/YbcL family Raf kinase inhibitor-like protein [Clostridia bacterium]|nr:YbhB/YbcL family Raf kinase inhibitor-like protein [Clostridia bacterium]